MDTLSVRKRINFIVTQGDGFCSRRCPHFDEAEDDLDFSLCTLHARYIEYVEGQPARTEECVQDPETWAKE